MTPAAGAARTGLTTAERVRSAYLRAQALVAVAGTEPVSAPVCHLLADGSVAIAVPATGELAAAVSTVSGAMAGAGATGTTGQGVPAMLELTDHAPLRLRERVRALVWVGGRLQRVPPDDVGDLLDRIAAEDANPALLQVWSPRCATAPDRGCGCAAEGTAGPDGADVRYALLRLTVESAVLADATGAESVPLDELLAARPDPLCAVEAGWLQHLDAAHPEVVARLAEVLPPRLRRGAARPLGVDRYGIWLRIEDADRDHDVRLTFGRPVDDVAGLNRAVRVLMGCPFRNGLQARRP